MQLKLTPLLAALISGVLYLAFLSRNPVVDAVYYAWCGRYGQELAHPHHLLYNYWLRGIMLITGGAGEKTILLFQAANALAGAACIGLLASILQKNGLAEKTAFWLCLAVAGCWGFARFATDNEAYVLPILFSLMALRTLMSDRWAWAAGLFSAIAILFHQVQLWWALPMLWLVWRQGGMRAALVFAGWHLVVPVGYWAVWAVDVDQPLVDFLLGEFKTGGVKHGWDLWVLAKTGVQVVRAFLQANETMLAGLPPMVVVPIILVIGALVLGSFLVNRATAPSPLNPLSPLDGERGFSRFGLVLALLLLAFSLFAQGNAEFLAGLPFAAAFWLGSKAVLQKMAPGLAASLWLWNILFGHRIQVFYQIEPDRQIAQIIHSQKADAALLTHKLEVDWWHAYLYGERPANTYHLQWIKPVDMRNLPNTDSTYSADSAYVLYSRESVQWKAILYEDCRPAPEVQEIFKDFITEGNCLNYVPGYEQTDRIPLDLYSNKPKRLINTTRLVEAKQLYPGF